MINCYIFIIKAYLVNQLMIARLSGVVAANRYVYIFYTQRCVRE